MQQSAENSSSNLMDTDHSASLSASSPPLNSAVASSSSSSSVVASSAGGATAGGVAGAGGPGATAGAARSGESLEYHCRMLEEELQSIKDSESKLKQQYAESQRRERILARRLAVKEQEMQDFASQIAELKTAQAPGQAALRSALLDPAVNILFQKLKGELQQTKAKLEETQNELSAWKFTPDSNTGKRLMAKCRLLYQENEELGKMTSNGRLAKLEGELALQKSYNEEVKKSQLELDDFLQEMDEDVEGMQSTIVFLQQELKHTKEEKETLEKEVLHLRSYVNGSSGGSGAGGGSNGDEDGTDSKKPRSMDTSADCSTSEPAAAGAAGGGNGNGSSSTGVYLVNGSNNKLKQTSAGGCSSGDQSESLVYQNRTHCGNPDVLLNGVGAAGGDELVSNEQQAASRLTANAGNAKKANNARTAKTVGGKKRNYAEDADDQDQQGLGGGGGGGDGDEDDSGHYDDGSNNGGKMLAPGAGAADSQPDEDPLLLSSSNKRMTRSGKSKPPPKLTVKKLRRASVLSDEDAAAAEGFATANGAN